jgi:hypothetical protein
MPPSSEDKVHDLSDSKTLSANLSKRLIDLARDPVDYRFLINHVPLREQAQALLDSAPPALREQLSSILERRIWES